MIVFKNVRELYKIFILFLVNNYNTLSLGDRRRSANFFCGSSWPPPKQEGSFFLFFFIVTNGNNYKSPVGAASGVR